MKPGANAADQLQPMLAGVFRWGTLIATGLVAAGMVLALVGQHVEVGRLPAASMGSVKAGIALFILLPILRVVLMLLCFLGQRDRQFSIAAAAVLAIILFGFTLNLAFPSVG